jgi:hypothetical protein
MKHPSGRRNCHTACTRVHPTRCRGRDRQSWQPSHSVMAASLPASVAIIAAASLVPAARVSIWFEPTWEHGCLWIHTEDMQRDWMFRFGEDLDNGSRNYLGT